MDLSVILMMNPDGNMQVQNGGELDPQGGGVPDHKRRAHARRESTAEPGVVRDHLDGAGVR